MTKLRICGLLTFLPSQNRNGDGPEKLGFQAVVCVAVLFCLAAAIAAPAQSAFFSTLASFDGSDGREPYSGVTLVRATDGNFYGTTLEGGSNCGGPPNYGCGTVFKATPTGTLTAIYSFCSQPDCTDGSYPSAGLVQGADGNLYGTTSSGGANGTGTVFKITLNGTLTTLHNFCPIGIGGACCDDDGWWPYAPLVQASDGNFYGSTTVGGPYCAGTIFKITPAGALTTLYSFGSQQNDGGSTNGLVQASDGNFYGTTSTGGSSGNCNGGCGTIFQLTPSGTLTTLHSFDGADGHYPASALIQATDRNLYGTTAAGGADGDGTVFKFTLAGTLTTLHAFTGSDGDSPQAALVQGGDRNFYGTTWDGGSGNCGSDGCGTIFRITLAGELTTLHSFDEAFGSGPNGLMQALDGNLYGTTYAGGANGYGTVFRQGVPQACATCRP
jgi:uncharacterized repeat protein (TIGR03803 family)